MAVEIFRQKLIDDIAKVLNDAAINHTKEGVSTRACLANAIHVTLFFAMTMAIERDGIAITRTNFHRDIDKYLDDIAQSKSESEKS